MGENRAFGVASSCLLSQDCLPRLTVKIRLTLTLCDRWSIRIFGAFFEKRQATTTASIMNANKNLARLLRRIIDDRRRGQHNIMNGTMSHGNEKGTDPTGSDQSNPFFVIPSLIRSLPGTSTNVNTSNLNGGPKTSFTIRGKENERSNLLQQYGNSKSSSSNMNNQMTASNQTASATNRPSRTFSLQQPHPQQHSSNNSSNAPLKASSPVPFNSGISSSNHYQHHNDHHSNTKTKRSPLVDLQTPQTSHSKKDRPPRSVPSSQRNKGAGTSAVSAAIPLSYAIASPLVRLPETETQTTTTALNGDTKKSPAPTHPPPPTTTTKASASKVSRVERPRQRVLLFGETMESLFCIRATSSPEQVALAQSLVDGTRMDDPSTWRRVLELVMQLRKEEQLNRQPQRLDDDVIRLHRRATLRFPLDEQSQPVIGSSSTTDNNNNAQQNDFFHIWLSFARAQEVTGSIEEARRTYRFMENQKLTRHQAAFYLALADFEQRQQKDDKDSRVVAQGILKRGIREKAQPLGDLAAALKSLEVNSTTQKDGEDTSVQVRFAAHDDGRMKLSPRKRLLLHRVNTPKRPKLDHEAVGPQRLKISPTSSKLPGSSAKSNPIPAAVTDGQATASNAAAAATARAVSAKPLPPKRPSLTSRLACKGLSGKAKRVDTELSFMSLGDDNYETESESDEDSKGAGETDDLPPSCGQAKALKPTESKPRGGKGGTYKPRGPSFNKMDLSYMWEWDPNDRLKAKEQDTTQPAGDTGCSSNSGESSHGSHNTTSSTHAPPNSREAKPKEARVPKIAKESSKMDEDRQPAEAPSTTNKAVPKTYQPTKMQTEPADANAAAVGATATTKDQTGSPKDQDSQKEIAMLSKKQELMDKANLEFLPLVHESNILRVNGTAYAKLGVIGKGGSSKVYRALSKKCSVVGIKKVKLDGMDEKGIEGYANEISLLKRLRGNPAIIHMYDSEVDIERKSIFVVMELGEVDLNHVLQQRAVSKTSRSLNLNFIRLTWQQMLSAVHCIHEERIIHSDLKPANFLFVRGALKLIDFGIAKAIANDNTTSIYRESHIGTLNYMSPEAILDTGSGEEGPRMKIGRASDVWSLGCILYEMVYGKTPFAKLHFVQKLQAIVNPNYAIEFPKEGDAAAVDAIKLCLQRVPEERPPIMGEGGLLNEHWFLHANR